MLMYDGADLTRIVNKVLGKHFTFLETKVLFRTLQCLYLGLGLDEVQQWLDSDIVGCLQSFFIKCQTGNYLRDPEVIFLE